MAEQKENAPSFKLRYFGAPGRAQPIRLALAVSGFAFTDEWATGAELKADKEAGKSVGLPELTVYDKDGKVVNTFNQSIAMLRYIGSLAGLYGDNALQRLQIDEIEGLTNDAISGLLGQKPEERPQSAKDGKLALVLKFLQRRLEENEKAGNKQGYAVGDKLSIADLLLAHFLGALTIGYFDGIPKDVLTGFPRLQKSLEFYRAKYDAIESLKSFTASFTQRMKDGKDDAKKASVKVVTYPGKTCPDIAAK